MIYYTGDIHGDPTRPIQFCREHKLKKTDTIVLLGDVGANYYGDARDAIVKKALMRVLPTVLCIHGNHEMRPSSIPSYHMEEWNGGRVWVEDAYPNLLFAKDGEIFTIDGIRHIVIGGAYSVDKHYRLRRGYHWWADEQPSVEVKAFVESQLVNNDIDVVLSHTCPFKYEPIEMYLPMIPQDTVDDSTERWLNDIEEHLSYKAWFCGHRHTDKRIDKIHFLFKSFEGCEYLGLDEEVLNDA